MARKLRADHVGQHRTAFEKNRQKILATATICGICGQPVDREFKYPHPMSAVIDHIIPIDKGGHPSDLSNLQLAHRWCNRQKSDKLIDNKKKFQEEESGNNLNPLPLHYDWKNYKAN